MKIRDLKKGRYYRCVLGRHRHLLMMKKKGFKFTIVFDVWAKKPFLTKNERILDDEIFLYLGIEKKMIPKNNKMRKFHKFYLPDDIVYMRHYTIQKMEEVCLENLGK